MTTNSDMVKLWNSDAAQTWWTRPERYDAMIGPLGDRVLAAAALQPGERVLDVGCGAGQLTTQAAAAVGRTGQVVGLDISRELLSVTGRRAAEAGLGHVEVLEADAQAHAFEPSSYDVVISRFGVMFFADPVVAFANLRAATKDGGRLAFVCWQPAPSNEWATVPLFAVAAHVGFPEPPPPGAPGPFAFGDPDRVRQVLTDAGWSEVDVEDVQTTVSPGGARNADEAVAFITEDTFGKMLLANAEPDKREAALAALRTAYEEHNGPDGIRLKAAVWVVTATR
ncbi:MAG: SAM-dependent methyltransferase [Frankiales bacterium]|nr:SAM-dependent methyltransferase [Frankiales bacterium]